MKYAWGVMAAALMLITLSCWIAYHDGYQAGRLDQLEREAKWKRNDEHDMDLCKPGTLWMQGHGAWSCEY